MQMTESSGPSSFVSVPKTNGVTPRTNGHMNVVANASVTNSVNGADEEEHTPLENLLAVSETVVRQAIDFVRDDLSSDEQLTFRSKYIPGSTIGKHLRHARDHFILLLESLDADTGKVQDELSYDVRTRNTPMETSCAAAMEALDDCANRLVQLVPKSDLDADLVLNAVTPHMQRFKTSFGRELWFAALHAVHHYSMIRVIAGEQGIKLEDTFGFAPSTLVYHGTEGPLGKSKF